jgi:hypothetical protein
MTYGYDPNDPRNAPPPPPPLPRQPYGYNPYAPPMGAPPYPPAAPRKSGKRLGWIIAGVGGLSILLCCGGIAGLAYFGMGLVATEVRNLVREHPVVVEHIGEIQTIKLNFTETGAADDADTFVYDLTGTKGRGVLTAKHVTNAAGDEELVSGTLRLPNGEEYDLMQDPLPE